MGETLQLATTCGEGRWGKSTGEGLVTGDEVGLGKPEGVHGS